MSTVLGFAGVEKRNGKVSRRQPHRTAFGDLLAHHLERREMTQEDFARRMRDNGYPERMGRNMVSYIMNHNPRVYPLFFAHAKQVLKLTARQRDKLVLAWSKSAVSEDDRV